MSKRTGIQGFPVGAAAAIALGGAAAAFAACSSTPATTSSGTGGGTTSSGTGGGAVSFTPQGCSFSIAPRPEYQGFTAGSTTVGATPNIRRVRLGLGGNVAVGAAGRADPATTIAFGWQTDDGTLASQAAWGTDPDPSKWPAQNKASGVAWVNPKGTIGGVSDEQMHEVYACGLTPATTYYYRVGGGPSGSEVWSDVYAFTTAPSDPAATVKFGVSGDSRGAHQDAWHLLQQRMQLAGVGMQLFSGDMIDFAPDQGAWEKWLDDAWKDPGGPLTLPQILMLSAHGNHENHTSLFYGNLVLPQDQAKFPQWAELFYAVDVGPVHVVVVDDGWVVDPSGDPAYAPALTAWLDADLDAANKNRGKVPWIVTVHHHAEFSSSNHGTDADVLAGRAFFVPIWDKYHVDLALGGHDHNYERTKPLTGPAMTPTVHAAPADGTVYVVCAGSGADNYTPGTSAFTELSHGYDSGTPGGAIGVYGILTVSPTQLVLEAHELRVDKTDPIFDTLTITKP
jgi:hypothetical protein